MQGSAAPPSESSAERAASSLRAPMNAIGKSVSMPSSRPAKASTETSTPATLSSSSCVHGATVLKLLENPATSTSTRGRCPATRVEESDANERRARRAAVTRSFCGSVERRLPDSSTSSTSSRCSRLRRQAAISSKAESVVLAAGACERDAPAGSAPARLATRAHDASASASACTRVRPGGGSSPWRSAGVTRRAPWRSTRRAATRRRCRRRRSAGRRAGEPARLGIGSRRGA